MRHTLPEHPLAAFPHSYRADPAPQAAATSRATHRCEGLQMERGAGGIVASRCCDRGTRLARHGIELHRHGAVSRSTWAIHRERCRAQHHCQSVDTRDPFGDPDCCHAAQRIERWLAGLVHEGRHQHTRPGDGHSCGRGDSDWWPVNAVTWASEPRHCDCGRGAHCNRDHASPPPQLSRRIRHGGS